jgi:hypothetical protein
MRLGGGQWDLTVQAAALCPFTLVRRLTQQTTWTGVTQGITGRPGNRCKWADSTVRQVAAVVVVLVTECNEWCSAAQVCIRQPTGASEEEYACTTAPGTGIAPHLASVQCSSVYHPCAVCMGALTHQTGMRWLPLLCALSGTAAASHNQAWCELNGPVHGLQL